MIRQGEDHVEVLDRQEIVHPVLRATSPPAVAWHLGQWRLRQELYEILRWPHASHWSRWPPSFAVRQASMARMALRWRKGSLCAGPESRAEFLEDLLQLRHG